MVQERLLERISRLERGEEITSSSSSQVESIISHLARLLNTRQGSAAIAADYGVPDITNVPGDTIEETRKHIEEAIEKVVLKYEPRLANIRMFMQHEEKEKFSLRFRLEATLAEQENVPVIFETVVTTEGRISVT